MADEAPPAQWWRTANFRQCTSRATVRLGFVQCRVGAFENLLQLHRFAAAIGAHPGGKAKRDTVLAVQRQRMPAQPLARLLQQCLRLKRWRAAAMGRAAPMAHPTSHIVVVVGTGEGNATASTGASRRGRKEQA